MGIRPHLMLLCGIDDVQTDADGNVTDPRIDTARFDERWETAFDLKAIDDPGTYTMLRDKNGEPMLVGDVLHHDPEYGVPNVMGYEWDDLYAKDAVYALAACYPEFQQPGYRVLPTISEADDTSTPSQYLLRLREKLAAGEEIPRDSLKEILRHTHGKRLLHKFNQNYAGGFSSDFEWRYRVALHVLQAAGIKVGRRDLKLMLYWQWS